jgi:hypothetical protein
VIETVPSSIHSGGKAGMSLKSVALGIGSILLVLLLALAAVFAAYRLRGPTVAQREALALMQKDYRPQHGLNAFPLLWFMRYDVPEDQLQARMAADVEAERKRLEAGERVGTYAPDAPLLPEPEIDLAALCESSAPGCLARIAAHPDAVRAIVATHPVLLSRARAFDQTDYYWNEFPGNYLGALVALPDPAPRLWLSAFALQYADGDRAGAISSVCRDLGAWRRMLHGTNSLVAAMLASARGDGALRLYAEMLAGLRTDESVPAECANATRPIEAADVDRCAQMAGEFAVLASAMRSISTEADGTAWGRLQAWLMFDAEQSDAWRAEQLAPACADDAVARMLLDQSALKEAQRPVTQRLECVSSWIGCVLADIAKGTYPDYEQRTLDFAAHLRLAATLTWMREAPDGLAPATRFAQRPAFLRSEGHHSGFDVSANALFVDNLRARHEARFTLVIKPADPNQQKP